MADRRRQLRDDGDLDLPDLNDIYQPADMQVGQAFTTEQIPAVLSAIRHNIRGIQTLDGLQNEVVMRAAVDARDARDGMASLREEMQYLRGNRTSNPDDRGAIGRLEDGMRALRRQQWGILAALLGAMGTGFIDLILRLGGHS